MITNPNNKWAERDWFLCDHYLPFAIGGGYIISANPIHKITITSDYLQLYNSEDISVSVWLSAYKIERKDGEHFRTAVQNDYNCAGHACFLLTIKICRLHNYAYTVQSSYYAVKLYPSVLGLPYTSVLQ